jgi:C4-dicarboxylate-specific signal transduction histidine kinase
MSAVNAVYDTVELAYRQALRRVHALPDDVAAKHSLSNALFAALEHNANPAAQLAAIAVVARGLDDAEWYVEETRGGAVRS